MKEIFIECQRLLHQQKYITFSKYLASLINHVYLDELSTHVNFATYCIHIGKPFSDYGDIGISLALRHELSHIILNHYQRGIDHKVENADMWNSAIDLELSNWYNKDDIKFIENVIPGSYYVDSQLFVKYKNWDAEDIYDDMMKNCVKITVDLNFNNIISEDDPSDESDDDKPSEGSDNVKKQINLPSVDEIKKELREQSKTFPSKIVIDSKSGQIHYDLADKTLFDIESDYREIIKPMNIRNYTSENEVYSGTGLIFSKKHKQRRKCITIHCFVDRSGSMDEERTRDAENIVKKLNDNKHVIIVRHTFSDQIDKVIGGGTNYDAIIQYCKQFLIQDVVIITDDDLDNVITDYTFNKSYLIGVKGLTPNVKIKSKNNKVFTI